MKLISNSKDLGQKHLAYLFSLADILRDSSLHLENELYPSLLVCCRYHEFKNYLSLSHHIWITLHLTQQLSNCLPANANVAKLTQGLEDL